MSDLANLSTATKNETGSEMILTHPETGEDLLNSSDQPMTIVLVGRDSKEFRRYQAGLASKARQKKKDLTWSELKKSELELLASCTRDFKNLEFNGDDLAFTYDNAINLYKDFSWIKDQVDVYITDVSNFLT